MTEAFRRGRLFLGSYALLFVLLALRFEERPLQLVCAVLAAVGFGDMLWIVLVIARRTSRDPIRINRVSDSGVEVAGYLATYLLPFLTVAEPTIRDLAAYVIFLAVVCLIYVRSDMAQLNPTLYLLGRRVVSVETEGGWSGYVVVRSSMGHSGDIINVVSLNTSIRVQVQNAKEPSDSH